MAGEKRHPKGGEFLVFDIDQTATFIPEHLDEEQSLMKQSVRDFVTEKGEDLHQLDKQKPILQEAGEMGLVGAHIPETYGGLEFDSNTVTAILEELGRAGGSFDTTFAAHTGIGMLPILYFGSDEIKQKYLPELSTGQKVAAYCLTEPSAGSDALAAKSTATLTEDGNHYLINGQKMWISNAGFADVFIVFAKIDGEHFTGFVIDANTEGISLGAEEAKLGIKGSSTRQVFFEQVKVPVKNLLGEEGKGHLIAFNVLNIGRYKLGNMCLGGIKQLIDIGIDYALERKQFNLTLATFGAIHYKVSQQQMKTFALESMVYRVSDMLKNKKTELVEAGQSFEQALLNSASQYAIECAMIKIYGSETLHYVVDETLQIHGGNGFSEEFAVARAYRDSRINKIYEGTNEINRLLSVSMLTKRVAKGELDFVDAAWAVQKELTKLPSFNKPTGHLEAEKEAINNFKKMALMTSGAAVKYQMEGKINLKINQQIVMNLADIMMNVFAAECVYLRIAKLQDSNDDQLEIKTDLLRLLIHETQDLIAKTSRDALASFATGDEQRIMLMGIQRFANYPAQNVQELRRGIAKHTYLRGKTIMN